MLFQNHGLAVMEVLFLLLLCGSLPRMLLGFEISTDLNIPESAWYGPPPKGEKSHPFCEHFVKKTIEPSPHPIPVLIINRDRLRFLQEVVTAYDRIQKTTPLQLIIVDNNSTYPPMVDYLKTLPAKNVIVSYWKEEWTVEAMNLGKGEPQHNYILTHPVNYALDNYLKDHKADFYVVQDSDISLRNAPADILQLYQGILQICPRLAKVGPHIMLSDIPLEYKYRSIVYETYDMYFKRIPWAVNFNDRITHITLMGVDSHWSIHRTGKKFTRLEGAAVRTYAPYACSHLDFYDIVEHEDTKYYKAHDYSKLNHYTYDKNHEAPSSAIKL